MKDAHQTPEGKRRLRTASPQVTKTKEEAPAVKEMPAPKAKAETPEKKTKVEVPEKKVPGGSHGKAKAVLAPKSTGKEKMVQMLQPLKNEVKVDPDYAGQLWADKYKPQSEDDLLGQKDIVMKLRSWLLSWDRIHRYGDATERRPSCYEYDDTYYTVCMTRLHQGMLFFSFG